METHERNSADRVYQKLLLSVQKKNTVVHASTAFELWVEYMYLYSTNKVSNALETRNHVIGNGNHAERGLDMILVGE